MESISTTVVNKSVTHILFYGLKKSVPGLRWVAVRLKSKDVRIVLPSGKAVLVLPKKKSPEGNEVVAARDQQCADLVEQFLYRFGYPHETQRIATESTLAADLRSNDLYCVCGPAANSLTRDLLDTSNTQPLLNHIEFIDHEDRDSREFHWRNRVYRSSNTRDYALFAVKPNPYNPKKKAVLLFGLRDIGTLGAGALFSLRNKQNGVGKVWAQLAHEFRTGKGYAEVLLCIDHDDVRQEIHNVRIATPEDGEKLGAASSAPLAINSRVLQRIYSSIEEHPRPSRYSNSTYDYTVRRNYDVAVAEESTWSAGEGDIVVRGVEYMSSSTVRESEDIQFHTEVVNGIGDLVSLPAENDTGRKRFLLFPIPPVALGRDGPRVRITMVWPKNADRLRWLNTRDDYRVKIKHAATPVDQVRIRFHFESPDHHYRVTERFSLPDERRSHGEYHIRRSYELELSNVHGGAEFDFSIERVR
jgi:hypothetical protein